MGLQSHDSQRVLAAARLVGELIDGRYAVLDVLGRDGDELVLLVHELQTQRRTQLRLRDDRTYRVREATAPRPCPPVGPQAAGISGAETVIGDPLAATAIVDRPPRRGQTRSRFILPPLPALPANRSRNIANEVDAGFDSRTLIEQPPRSGLATGDPPPRARVTTGRGVPTNTLRDLSLIHI